MNLLLNRAKANTTTAGTGAVTPGAAVVPYRTWAAAGAVAGNRYAYLLEDGNDWEIGSGIYNGTTVTRPGPGVDPSFESSTGALLNLSGSATIACVANRNSSGEEVLREQTVAAASSIVWDATLINTFKAFKVRWEGVFASAASSLTMQLSPDNGVTWRTTNYNGTRLIEQINSTFAQKANTGNAGLVLMNDLQPSTNAFPAVGEMMVYGLLNAAVKKFMTNRGVILAGDGNRYDYFGGGEYIVAEAINAVRIIPAGATTFSGNFQLLGVM